ncbi:hypothetical protein Dd703_1270 [Musicola paradisiaca Ech703]|uniref:Uncharacterized protein n=1 Tax=Musicola paradisiaca (strain Ech703) TaxID=579405 RepID=C6CD31_MUSP7|nr:hypothetical protein Dd703_1270 [Musicola paradisiaca Ech703]
MESVLGPRRVVDMIYRGQCCIVMGWMPPPTAEYDEEPIPIRVLSDDEREKT